MTKTENRPVPLSFNPKDRLEEFFEENQTALRKKVLESDASKQDLDYAQRMIFKLLEESYENNFGVINWKRQLKDVNRFYFFMRPSGQVSKAIAEGKHKGFFKSLLGMDRERVLSDFRISLFYVITMRCWMYQRMHFVKKYMEKTGQKVSKRQAIPIDSKLVPSSEYFRDYGQGYWSSILFDAINQYNRRVILLRSGCEAMESRGNITKFYDKEGEVWYGLNQDMEIKQGKSSKVDALRQRRN